MYHTKAGVSSLYSDVFFLDEINEEELSELPDIVLSDTLQKDFESTVSVCVLGLKDTKYLPTDAQIGVTYGALPDGEREGVSIKGWQDFSIFGVDGDPLYTPEMLNLAEQEGSHPLSVALWFIVKDICDSGQFLSQDWYRARIVYEYFKEYPEPLRAESAYLIGELFKEMCIKHSYEGDLADYYQGLLDAQNRRKAGAAGTKEKAEELRQYCVGLFVEMSRRLGPRLMMAHPEVQAEELRKEALKKRPEDFMRAGKPYSKEWFLRNIIEDRRLDIVQSLEIIQ